ncbi:MAG: WecB/TagA/CpsF family glycosyltransferase [bacterium]|nr:WecB/TagA/CpsF family glycosyltransferase [bacterium]
MNTNKYLNIDFHPSSKKDILEKILMYMSSKYTFVHIVSLNPENMVMAQTDIEYRNMLSQSDIQIIDGIGTAVGAAILGFPSTDRLAGVDLMDLVIHLAAEKGFRILLLGGKPNLAESLADCYKKKLPNLSVKGEMGYVDILASKSEEDDRVFSIVADYKPQIIFAAFGSPAQEKWFYAHKHELNGSVCIGVGGGFDFLSGEVSRAPQLIRSFGFEWLYRLITQPWRIKRQLRLIEFIRLVLLQKFGIVSA